jgi:hypothetical protein
LLLICIVLASAGCGPKPSQNPPGADGTEPGEPAPVYAQVKQLLQGDTLHEAVETAARALPEEKTAVAELLSQWAAGILASGLAPASYEQHNACNAYVTAMRLSPEAVHLYANLGELVARWHLENIGMGHNVTVPGEPDPWWQRVGTLALAAWKAAAEANPELRRIEGFDRVGSLLAIGAREYRSAAEIDPGNPDALICVAIEALRGGDRESARLYAERLATIAPQRGDVMCLLAELGLLKPLETIEVFSATLPTGFSPSSIQARPGLVMVSGYQGDWRPGLYPNTYVVQSDSPEKARLIEQAGNGLFLLSPTGSLLARTIRPTQEADDQVSILDLRTGVERPLAAARPILGLAWAPDESAVAVSTRQELALISLDGSSRRVLGLGEEYLHGFENRLRGWQVPSSPQYLAQGTLLGAQMRVEEEGPYGPWPGTVCCYDLASGSRRDVGIKAPYWEVGRALWSPDGQLIACDLEPHEGASRGVMVVSPEEATAGHAAIASGYVYAGVGEWAKDGDHLLFWMGLWTVTDHWEEASNIDKVRVFLWAWDAGARSMSWIDGISPSGMAIAEDGTVYGIAGDEQSGYRIVGLRIEGR